jgi:hypothetical protein
LKESKVSNIERRIIERKKIDLKNPEDSLKVSKLTIKDMKMSEVGQKFKKSLKKWPKIGRNTPDEW